MPVLAATNIDLAYGERVILGGVSLSLEGEERIGVVGRNGCGKSSLLKVLAGELAPDAGSVVLQKGARLGYLAQDVDLGDAPTLRDAAAEGLGKAKRLEAELHELFEAMGDAEGDDLARLLRRQEEIEHRLEAAGGVTGDHRVDEVLLGLGFETEQFKIPAQGLSGGQRARVALARLLLDDPGVLLLDEPTNHLDITGREWLETFLRDEHNGAVILISHDRRLLDGVVDRIVEVEQTRLIDYPGNYSAFRRLRGERRLAQLRTWEKQQTQFKREAAFIRQYKAGQRAKQAKGRESRLERALEGALERPVEMGDIALRLPKAERTGDVVASARGITKRYPRPHAEGETVLFDRFDFKIHRGERWGIVGPNGAGKTTLVRCLLGELAPDAGEVSLGAKVAVGHFRQTHDDLDPEMTVPRLIHARVKKETDGAVLLGEQETRDLAGAFLFSGEEQEKQVGLLSGGERARAVLASLLASAKNVLVLDEPTNHLDIPSAERLEEALARRIEDPKTGKVTGGTFEGTLRRISHDRARIDATCDRLLILDGEGNAEVFVGSYDEWHEKQLSKRNATPEAIARPAQAVATGVTPGGPAHAPKDKTRGKFSWMRLEQIEEKLGVLNERMGEIDRVLADPDVWTDHERANALTTERDALRDEIEGLETEWLRKAE